MRHLSTATSRFGNNTATRGASIYSDPSASVVVDGNAVQDANTALAASVEPTNTALAYGVGVASPPRLAAWTDLSPLSAGPAMPGSNLCAQGCVATLGDTYGNVATTPTVVEIAADDPRVAVVDGPRYLLIADGVSSPIPDLAIRLVGDPTALPASVDVLFGLSLVGDPGGALSTAETIQCQAGYGATVAASGQETTVGCEACLGETFSAGVSWVPCQSCAEGTAADPATPAATSCDWCAAGFGWDGDACVPCGVGTFSAAVTLKEPCTGCAAGLTTAGTGADACTAAVDSFLTTTPFWVWIAAGVVLLLLIACVGACAWRYSRRKVISHYYIGAAVCVCACVCMWG